MVIEEKLQELGYQLPEAPKPLAAYVPAVYEDKMVFTAGQLPIAEGKLLLTGKVGKDVTIEDAVKSAEVCAINCLSVIKSAIDDLDKIKRILKVTVFVNSADGFSDQPQIANGASEFLVKVFGDKGKHARSAVGVSELPLNAPVEIEMIASVE